MDLFKYTKRIIDKVVGASKLHAVQKNAGELLDPMQKYLTVGEYHVDARDATPDGRPFTLTVYQDDQGILHQALSPESTDSLAAEYDRKFVPELNRFKAFRSRKTGRRYVVEDYLARFVSDVKKEIREGDDSVNIGVITDTWTSMAGTA